MKHDGGWTRKESRYLFESSWFNLRQDSVELPSGNEITYTMIEHPGYAMVVPLLDDKWVILEKVYRYTVQETVIECPSGGLDGESPEVAARRELLEETGYAAKNLISIGSFYGSDGISDEGIYFFLATGLTDTGRTHREATEQIELEILPFEEALDLAYSGNIKDAPSTLAVILAHRKLLEMKKLPGME
jgi:ADP-ribose pyrophosphatase